MLEDIFPAVAFGILAGMVLGAGCLIFGEGDPDNEPDDNDHGGE